MGGEKKKLSALEYLNLLPKIYKNTDVPFEFGIPEAVTLGGHELARVRLQANYSGRFRYSMIYALSSQSFVMQFVLGSPNEAGLIDIERTMQSLRFQP